MYKWNELAFNELGTKEVKGQKDNPKIMQYFTDVGHAWVEHDETPWCAAYVGAMLERSGLTSTRQLNARSYLNWGREIETPVPGCIVIFKRGNSSWQGHVAFYVGDDGDKIRVLGGNQGNTVKISSYKKSDLLGYRLPKTKMASKTNWAAATGGAGVLASQSDAIGGMIDKWNEISAKGGDFVDKFGSIIDSSWFPFIAIGVVGLLIYIMMERNKKVDKHGI